MKTNRHTVILDIINSMDIDTQEELAIELARRGFKVTQATISRDIKELRLIKVLSSNGSYKYATVDRAEVALFDRYVKIFAQSVLSIIPCGNLIVLKTIAGSANVAAEAVDALKWPEIAGSIAGDNTIFVVIKDAINALEIVERFKELIR